MAQEAVNSILQAFQNSLRMRMERDQYLQSLQERQSERKEDIAWREKQAKTAQDQQDLQNKAAKAAFDLQKKQIETAQAAKDLEDYQVKGIIRPGVQVIPGMKPPQQPETQTQVPVINQSTPIPGQPQVGVGAAYPGLSDQAQQKPLVLSELQNSTVIPESGMAGSAPPLSQRPDVLQARLQASEAEQKQNRVTQFREQAELGRQKVIAAEAFERQKDILKQTQDFQDDQRRKAESAVQLRDESKLANSLKIAQLRASQNLTGFGGTMATDPETGLATYTPNDPEPIIRKTLDQAQHGKITLEQIKKTFPNQKAQSTVLNALQDRGIVPLTDKELEKTRELEQVASVTEDLFKLHQLRNEHWFAIQFPMSKEAKAYESLREQVKGELAGVSKWMNNVPRFTNVELNKVQDALLPSKDIISHGTDYDAKKGTGTGEFKKYLDFVKDIQDSFNSTLSRQPENQKSIIRDDMGLNKFPYLGNAISRPGAPVPRMGGSATPTDKEGGKPAHSVPAGRMLVREKATGQKGHIDPKTFDPTKYERVSQ